MRRFSTVNLLVSLVAQYVPDGTGRSVHLVTYAHSGAKIADASNSRGAIRWHSKLG